MTVDEQRVRRGLPRRPGGEPWPVVAGGTAVVDLAAETPAVVDLAAESPAAAAEPRRGLPRAPVAPSTEAATPPAVVVPVTPAPEAASTVSGGLFARLSPRAWFVSGIVLGGGFMLIVIAVVAGVRWFLGTEAGNDFLATYPGQYELPEGAPVGIPAWIGWQHFFNAFLMVLIIRSGLRVRTEKKPPAFWSPRGNPSRKISLTVWFHQSLDLLWLINGVVFVVLLFATGQWMRIVPTSWEVIPNAVSAGLQYASLDWPAENGWINYNSLQQLAYFTTIFVATPLAVATGVRMSGVWPKKAETLSRLYPIEWARRIHFPVMVYFLAFIAVHVILVFGTGALRNLNHMYAARDVVDGVGLLVFAGSLLVMVGALVAARPVVLAPIAGLVGKVSGR